MIRSASFRRPMPFARALLAAMAGLLVIWACRMNEAEGDTRFNLAPDSAWIRCDSLLVELLDTSGAVLDTLFYDSLKSLDQLKGLDGSKYEGGRAVVHIVGKGPEGERCAEQTRSFDDKGGSVIVDTVSEPGALPKSITFEPASLNLKVGDTAAKVKARIEPKFAAQLFEWSVDDQTVASFDLANGPNSSEVLVIPLKNGTARIKAKAKQGPVSAELVVQVGSSGGRTVSLQPDSLDLYLGGRDSALKASTAPEAKEGEIEWSSSDEAVVKVDDQGRVHGLKEGTAAVRAKFGEASASARVRVKRDVPTLTVANKPGTAVNAPIVFSPRAVQEYGAIAMFKYDLDGDSAWDDSLPGPFLGTTVDLPPQTASFPKEGAFKVRFLVRDTEGNEAIAVAGVEIGNQPPEVIEKSKDTLVSINDFVPLKAKVRDAEGKVALLGWDYDGDGKLDDSVTAQDSTASIAGGRRFAKPGKHVAMLYATDDAGKTGVDSVRIAVVLDPPEADMGPDISVIAGSPVSFSVKGADKFGAIAKRELKIGPADFLILGKQDTTLVVPGDSGKVQVIGRVTDDDGNGDEDTMVVTLLPPSKTNNDLSSLIPSAGTLTPGFKPVTVAYSLAVGYGDSLVSVTALTTDPAATLLINGKPAASGKPSDSVAVAVGTTLKAFEIVVTAQDGNQKTYTLAVTRAPSADASLSKLEPAGFALKPGYKPEVFEYADTVAFKVGSVKLTPTASHPSAKITVNDTAVTSGNESKPVALEVGDNLIKVNVTAQDGKTKSTYNVKVVRRARILVGRVVGPDTARVDSLEAPLNTVVTLKAPDTTGFHFTKWVVFQGNGTLQDSANPAKMIVKSPTVRVLASFAVNVYTITGTISGFAGGAYDHATIRIEHGKDTSITVTPLVGYRVLSVTDSSGPLSTLGSAGKFGPKTFALKKVTGNRTLVATFLKTYVLTSSVAGTGTISPLGTTEVDSGSTQIFALASGSPSTGVWVSAFTDNGASVVDSLDGDRMNGSKYTLSSISANHTIAATFDVRTYRMIVSGYNLCVRKIESCPVGQLCLIKLCPASGGPSLDTIIAPHGATYSITTDSVNSCGTRFGQWNKDGVQFSLLRSFTTPPVTADVTYGATYPCPTLRCCIIIIDPIDPGPIIRQPAGAATQSLDVQPQSVEPVQSGP